MANIKSFVLPTLIDQHPCSWYPKKSTKGIMYQRVITKATPITDHLKVDDRFSTILQMIKRIPNYDPSYILDYTIKDGTTHFVRFSTEEPDYGIEILRCIYSTVSDKILYQTLYISEDEDEVSFDILDEE